MGPATVGIKNKAHVGGASAAASSALLDEQGLCRYKIEFPIPFGASREDLNVVERYRSETLGYHRF